MDKRKTRFAGNMLIWFGLLFAITQLVDYPVISNSSAALIFIYFLGFTCMALIIREITHYTALARVLPPYSGQGGRFAR